MKKKKTQPSTEELKLPPVLTDSEQRLYIHRFQTAESSVRVAAAQKLVQGNVRLVYKIVRAFGVKEGEERFGDAIQEGKIGILDAASRFDLQLGFRFSTYATWWIRQRVSRFVRNEPHLNLFRLPSSVHDRLNKVKKYALSRGVQDPHKLTIGEVRKLIGCPAETASLLIVLLCTEYPLGFDHPAEGDRPLSETHGYTPRELTAQHFDDHEQEAVRRAIRCLPPNLQEVLILSYFEKQTNQEIAKAKGISRERVRQLLREAEHKLRALLKPSQFFDAT